MGLRKEDFYSPSQVMVHPDRDVYIKVLESALHDITEGELPQKHPVRILARHVRADSHSDYPEVREAWERTTVRGLGQLYLHVTGRTYQHKPDRVIREVTLGWEWFEYKTVLALSRRREQRG